MHFRSISPRLPEVAWKEKGCSDHMQIMEGKKKTAYTVKRLTIVFLSFDPETPSLLVS